MKFLVSKLLFRKINFMNLGVTPPFFCKNYIILVQVTMARKTYIAYFFSIMPTSLSIIYEDDVKAYACNGFNGLKNGQIDNIEKLRNFFEDNNKIDNLINKIRENVYEQNALEHISISFTDKKL